MNDYVFDKIYKKVPRDQKERLREFRSTHRYKRFTVAATGWEYISCGYGKETLVLLPGGGRVGETWFLLIMALESEYRIISPTYPPLIRMAELVDGIARLMESEHIHQAHILGKSFGGWLAQCFIRKHPEKVDKLILSHTSGPYGFSTRFARIGVILASLYPLGLLRMTLKREMYKLITSVPDTEREFWKAYWEEVFSIHTTKEDGTSLVKRMVDFIKNYRFSTDDLVNWPGKILILESDDDQAFQAPAREALKALYPQARVHTFHKAGHLPGYTNPEEYIPIVRNFLRET
jgi:pimeloyl-ACP methyl ester carboxylesterase